MTISESTFIRRSVSEALAHSLLLASARAAVAHNLRMSIAVVDESGLLKGFMRMDGASFTSGSVAQDKAFTGASGRATGLWHDALEADAVLSAGARQAIPRMVTLPGGFPIEVDGIVVGGLGVSGGHYRDDVAVALEALAEVGARHEW
ncbi:MAG: hypothetical protein JWQ19_1303 [Subtercola sp.]|nr:hypothetical protein [Subtercola sp.]